MILIKLYIFIGMIVVTCFAFLHEKQGEVEYLQDKHPMVSEELAIRVIVIAHLIIFPITLWIWPSLLWDLVVEKLYK